MKSNHIIDQKQSVNSLKSQIKKNFKVFVTEKDRALKNYVKSFEVPIIKKRDPSKQLYQTRNDVDRGIKVEVTLKVLMKKKKIDENGEEYFIYQEPYFNCKIFTINNKYEIIKALDKADEEINK